MSSDGFDITREAWTAFEAMVEDFRYHGDYRWHKEMTKFVATYGWDEVLMTDNPHAFALRTRFIFSNYSWFRHQEKRRLQLSNNVFRLLMFDTRNCIHDLHRGLDRLAVDAADPIIKRLYPPFGWGCRCALAGSLNERTLKVKGGTLSTNLPDWVHEPADTDGNYQGIDAGFGTPNCLPTLLQIVNFAYIGKAEELYSRFGRLS